MRRLAAACFWASAAGAGWVLGGYPAYLALLPARRPRTADVEPTVTVIVPTYNEFDTMPDKVRALSRLDYPADRLQVIVGVDGDPDLAGAARAADPNATIVELEQRSGKAAVIQAARRHADGEVLVLTDANNVLEPGSVRAAVRHFADPDVWAVAGQREESGSAYDRYEDLIRRLEARSGSVAAISGDFIAVRSDRMPALPQGVVNEDLWLLLELVRTGGRVSYEPSASSLEPALQTDAELRRRSRIGAGRLLLASELRGLPPAFAARVLSHKYGRLVLPFLMLTALGSSLRLRGRRPYRWAADAQLGLYALALLGVAGVEPPGRAGLPSRAARQLLVGNVAVGLGVVRALRGRQDARWDSVRS
jgi:hypothetical protein